MSNKDTVAFYYGVIAAILLLCLLDMPYGFYTLVRFVATAAFCYFAYKANDAGDNDRMILFIILAVLFQPFIKIPLGRFVWNIVDVVVAGYLIIQILIIVLHHRMGLKGEKQITKPTCESGLRKDGGHN